MREDFEKEYGDKEMKMAARIIKDLFSEVSEVQPSFGRGILGKIKALNAIDQGDFEVNGYRFEGIDKEGRVCNSEGCLDIKDVKWVRVEYYYGLNPKFYGGMCLMYIYLYLNDAHDDFNMDKIYFDIYPDPDTDDYMDSVSYKDCLALS